MMFSEDVLKKIFEKSFDDKVEKIYSDRSFICFIGKKNSMNYNPLDGCIIFSGRNWGRIGTIFYIMDPTHFSKLIQKAILAAMLDFSCLSSKST